MMTNRPYFNLGVENIQELANQSNCDLKTLREIQCELGYRNVPKAKALKSEVDNLIHQLTNRPYFNLGIEKIQELVKQSRNDQKILKVIQYELGYRNVPKAKALKSEVDNLIYQLSSREKTPPYRSENTRQPSPIRMSSLRAYKPQTKPLRIAIECPSCRMQNLVSMIEDVVQHLLCSECNSLYDVQFKKGKIDIALQEKLSAEQT